MERLFGMLQRDRDWSYMSLYSEESHAVEDGLDLLVKRNSTRGGAVALVLRCVRVHG